MIILGLGSNKGDRLANLKKAVAALSEVLQSIKTSPVYESQALLPDNASPEWNKNFLNMAVGGETTLTPQELLAHVKGLEKKLGRIPEGHWGPREIDIDILAYNDKVIDEPGLIIPHPHLLTRDFALVPLADLAPDWVYPVKGKSYGIKAGELARKLPKTLVKLDLAIT
jgi:2-amino-4-hydroxy-6-hydroxymethyldihydropteridine diphosphokinase